MFACWLSCCAVLCCAGLLCCRRWLACLLSSCQHQAAGMAAQQAEGHHPQQLLQQQVQRQVCQRSRQQSKIRWR